MGSSMSEDGPALGFVEDTPVMVRYPRTREQERGDRAGWPWLPGTILDQCGPDEWKAVIAVRELATLEDGSPAPEGTAEDDLWFPVCFRDASEIRLPGSATRAS
jgi:hypothetical protein